MDGELILREKEIPASYVYDHADSNGFLPLLKIHTLGYSFDLSNYATLLAGKLKVFAYSEEKLKRL
jgi:predicted alternative tryptophan synthase beta-subunit